MVSGPKFSKHDMVRFKRNPGKSGIVWKEPIRSDLGWQYEVFFDAQDRRFVIEQDLESVLENEVDEQGQICFGNLDDLRRSLLLIKLSQPLADHLYGLYASRTKFEVYQFKPAIKFLGNPDQRILIADEVGLGKTIEAGIIYLEMQARLDLMRVLVICPPALKYKWRDEMRSRFDENFTILDREKLDKFIDDYERFGENTRLRGIITLHLIRRAEIAERLAELRVNFDLVIFDEAHHLRNPSTMSNHVATILSDNADAMLLLTATPLHLGNQDLFHLLQILSPGEFDNLEAFRQRIEPNRHINRASQLLGQLNARSAREELQKVENYPIRNRFLKNPYYREVMNLLRNPNGDREKLIRAQHNLLELNTLAHIFTRTRKREVVTDAPVRVPHSLIVTFTDQERQFYEGVIEYVRNEYMLKKGGPATGWVTIMRERQAASCISAIREHFGDLVKKQYWITPEDLDLTSQFGPDDNAGEIEDVVQDFMRHSIKPSLKNLLGTGGYQVTDDSKFAVFHKALHSVLQQDPKSKILVFSFFRGTLEYLYKQLNHLGYGVQVIHGGVSLDDRKKRVEQFRDNLGFNILLSSEVGSEGLDFQFCHTLFNYDLPWNPMKVEQRIGRLDRFGQLHKRINIYNLIIENSIEERIFLRLYERIGIFRESVGDLEAILGDEIRELSTRIFSTRLTPQQEQQLAEQAIHNIIRRKEEMENFEKHRLEFMGQDAIFADEVQSAIESGKYISEIEIKSLVETFITQEFSRSRLEPDDEDPTCALVVADDLKKHVRDFIMRTRSTDQSAQDFLQRVTSSHIIPLTYSAEIAYQRKLVEFITLRHPLTQAAITYWQAQPKDGLPVYEVNMQTSRRPAGDYYFFVFLFQAEGLNKQSQLVPVLVSQEDKSIESELQETFLRLLQSATPSRLPNENNFDKKEFYDARQLALQYAANQRDMRQTEIQRSNDALVNARLNALEQTYQIKSLKVQTYLAEAREPRIRRMRSAQLRNIEARYRGSVDEVEKQREVSVSFSLELAGLAHIRLIAPRIKHSKQPEVIKTPAVIYLPDAQTKISPSQAAPAAVEELMSPAIAQEIVEYRTTEKEASKVDEDGDHQVEDQPQLSSVNKTKPDASWFEQEFTIKPDQIKLLYQKKRGFLSSLFGNRKTVLETVRVKTGAQIEIDARRKRITIRCESESALNEAIQLIRSELYS